MDNTTDRLIESINNNPDFSLARKIQYKNIVQRGREDLSNNLKVRDIVFMNGNPASDYDVITFTDELIIYKVGKYITNETEWDVKYPYRILIYKNDKWDRIASVCRTYDEALILYLSEKYIGSSRGSEWVMRMLGIQLPE